MVIISEIIKGKKAVWLDGRIPSKERLVSGYYSRLKKIGLDYDCLKNYDLDSRAKRKKKSRIALYIDILSSYIESHLKREEVPTDCYQTALFKPKWNSNDEPKAIKRYRGKQFWLQEGQKFEDDPIFNHIRHEDILHVKPYFPGITDEEYFQTIAIYELKDSELRNSPLEEFCRDFPARSANLFQYRNYPVFDDNVRKILVEIADKENNAGYISEVLLSHDFKIISSRTRSDQS